MKKICILTALLLFCLGIGECLYFLKDGFSERRIHYLRTQKTKDLDIATLDALKQPFHYLGRGRQCFAFASKDDRYVLKLPRTDIYRNPLWKRAIFSCKAKDKDHLERLRFIMNSFQIAESELKSQTGVVALHLGQSKPSGKTLHLIDALGSSYHISQDRTLFVLQEKKQLLFPTLLTALKKDPEEAKKILDSLIASIAERARKGILNRDRSFLRNYGYSDGKTYQIDIGSFFYSKDLEPDTAFQKSFRDSSDPIRDWLTDAAPELLPRYHEKINSIL